MNYREQVAIIHAIVKRAMLNDFIARHTDFMSLVMDIEAVHDTIGLDLDGLLTTTNGNFFHDITGIIGHLNRETKQLENCFTPRYAARRTT